MTVKPGSLVVECADKDGQDMLKVESSGNKGYLLIDQLNSSSKAFSEVDSISDQILSKQKYILPLGRANAQQ